MTSSVIYGEAIDVLRFSFVGITIDDRARRPLLVITGPPRTGEARLSQMTPQKCL
jgi:hypothetical protein